MCWGAKSSVLLYDYAYFEGGYIGIFCVSTIKVEESVE